MKLWDRRLPPVPSRVKGIRQENLVTTHAPSTVRPRTMTLERHKHAPETSENKAAETRSRLWRSERHGDPRARFPILQGPPLASRGDVELMGLRCACVVPRLECGLKVAPEIVVAAVGDRAARV